MARRHKTKKWQAEQLATIGSSSAAAALNRSKFRTRRELYDLMTGALQPPDLSENPDVRRGRIGEPIVRGLVQEALGRPVRVHPQTQFVYHPDLPWAHALPDAWITTNKGDRRPVQIKIPRPAKFQQIRMAGLDDEYFIAGQHELAVTEQDEMLFAVGCLITMDVILIPVKRTPDFISQLMEAECDLHGRVQKRMPPEADAPPAQIDMPEMQGEMRYLRDQQSIRAAEAYLEAKEIENEAADLLDQSKERLIQVGIDADHSAFEVTRDGSGILRCYHRQMAGRQTFDHKAAVKEDASLTRFYKTGKPFMRFQAFDLRKKGG